MSRRLAHTRKATGGVETAGLLLLVVVLGMGLPVRDARAQADTMRTANRAAASWSLLLDGQPAGWPGAQSMPVDSLRAAARAALDALHAQGYLLADVDSARIDTSRTPPAVEIFATSGPRIDVGEVQVVGAAALDATALQAEMDTRPGHTFDPARLEADLDALLRRYERAGFPLTRVRVQDLTLQTGSPPTLTLVIEVEEGPALTLNRVEVTGGERTRASYVARVAELHPGRTLVDYNPEAIQQRLETTTFFREVGYPELLIEADSGAVIRIPIVEEAPGAFDLVLGYQPAQGGQSGGGLVGNGHLLLRNLFGAGRELSLRINRLPGQVSSADVGAADPYVFGWPLRVAAEFHGIQQDSTYGKQQYGLEVGVRLTGGVQVFGTLSSEATRPGEAGQRFTFEGRQRVARASAFFAGLGLRIERVDRRINPRRGLFFETNLERGRKESTARRITADQDTTGIERTLLRQERLRAQGRVFLPTWRRQVAVLGGEALALLSDEYDLSDLFRFGGATSLRGYDEERFLVPFASRLFAEYRYQLDRTSYAFIFFDLGYVEGAETLDTEVVQGFYPGYGLGFQVGTDVGLIKLSLAGNPEDPTGVRAHLGLSIGL